MKNPKKFSDQEDILTPFIIAANTSDLNSACELLFIHGSDLTWGEKENGLFLVYIDTDERFDEVVQVIEARSKIDFAPLIYSFFQKLQPSIIDTVADLSPDLDKQESEEDKEKAKSSAMYEFLKKNEVFQLDKSFSKFFGIEQWLLFSNMFTSSLVRQAVEIRQRQLAATGMSENQYNGVLYALESFGLSEQIVRIAYPTDGFDFETSITSSGNFKATNVLENAKHIEISRLKSDLAKLKRGQDNALAIFIAAFINKHCGSQQAFSCAYYGEQNEAELDVVVPILKIGFEVKLYQAPFAQTNNKLIAPAADLRKQIPSYFKNGCEQVYYITNLSEENGNHILQMLKSDANIGENIELITGGIRELVPVLEEIIDEIRKVESENFSLRIQSRINKNKTNQ